jgi:hypothetical protein
MSYAGIIAAAKIRADAAREKIDMLKAAAVVRRKEADEARAEADAYRRKFLEMKRQRAEPMPPRIKAKIRPEPAPVEVKRPKEVVVGAKPGRCSAIIQSGKNRGKQCVNNAQPNSEFCGIHIRSLSGI